MRYIEVPTPDVCPFQREVGNILTCQHPDVRLSDNYLYLCKSQGEDFDVSCPLKTSPPSYHNTTSDETLPATASLRLATKLVRERTARWDIRVRDVTAHLIAQGYIRTTDNGKRIPSQRGVDSAYVTKGEYSQPVLSKAGIEYLIRRVKAGDFNSEES